eukprot:3663648-Pleurochrysis_carterae.AAC.1
MIELALALSNSRPARMFTRASVPQHRRIHAYEYRLALVRALLTTVTNCSQRCHLRCDNVRLA